MKVTPCRPTHGLFGIVWAFSFLLITIISAKECVDSVISSSYAAPMDATIEEQAETQLEEPKLEIGEGMGRERCYTGEWKASVVFNTSNIKAM